VLKRPAGVRLAPGLRPNEPKRPTVFIHREALVVENPYPQQSHAAKHVECMIHSPTFRTRDNLQNSQKQRCRSPIQCLVFFQCNALDNGSIALPNHGSIMLLVARRALTNKFTQTTFISCAFRQFDERTTRPEMMRCLSRSYRRFVDDGGATMSALHRKVPECREMMFRYRFPTS
jgi:hypothetical protein